MKDLVGFYQARNQAEQVRDELVASGFDRDDVKLYDKTASGNDTGFWQSIKETFGFADEADQHLYAEATKRGAVAVGVSFDSSDDQTSAQKAIQIMQRHHPLDLDRQAAEWKQQGWTGGQATARTTTQTTGASTTGASTTGASAAGLAGSATAGSAQAGRTQQASGKDVIPVVEEQLNVGKQAVLQGGIRVHSRVTEKPVEAQVQLRQEKVNVERHAVDRPLTDADKAFQDRTIEATETAERAVVSKQARVVEEISLNKDVQQTTQTVRDTVRKQDVQVEQIPAGQASATQSAGQFSTGDFVKQITTDQRFRGKDFTTLEPELRSTFERSYPNNKWEQFKDVIRRDFEKARANT